MSGKSDSQKRDEEIAAFMASNAARQKADALAVVDEKIRKYTNELGEANRVRAHIVGPDGGAVSAGGLPFKTFDECATVTKRDFLIKGVIATGEFSSWYGAPKATKSMVLTDLSVAIASGKDWRGYKCKRKAGVVIFAFEKAEEMRLRLSAHAQRDFLSGLPIAVVDRQVSLLATDAPEIMARTVPYAETKFGIQVGLVDIDSWSKALAPGDEDRAKDQNIAAAALMSFIELVGHPMHIATIGHSGKDVDRGERGSNAKLAHMDVEFKVSGTGDIRKVECTNCNRGPTGDITVYRIEIVSLGKDEDGDPITAGIVGRGEVKLPNGFTGSTRDQILLNMLDVALGEHGEDAGGYRVVKTEIWRAAYLKVAKGQNPSRDFNTGRDRLVKEKQIAEGDGLVRHAAPPMPPVGTVPSPAVFPAGGPQPPADADRENVAAVTAALAAIPKPVLPPPFLPPPPPTPPQ
jgi:AAA domain